PEVGSAGRWEEPAPRSGWTQAWATAAAKALRDGGAPVEDRDCHTAARPSGIRASLWRRPAGVAMPSRACYPAHRPPERTPSSGAHGVPSQVRQPIASGAEKQGQSPYNVARAGMTK